MQPLRLSDHDRAEIDADAMAWLEAGKHVAGAAADLQHPRALRNQELEIAKVFVMKEFRLLNEFFALRRDALGMRQNGRLA